MLFQIYGDNTMWQLLGWILVFAGLILMNELARRSKTGGIFCFLILPAVLTVYFVAIYVGAAMGADWALHNQTYLHMTSWFHYAKLYAATAGCIGFMVYVCTGISAVSGCQQIYHYTGIVCRRIYGCCHKTNRSKSHYAGGW